MYKIINWYTKRFKFPARGWQLFRLLLKTTGLYHKTFVKKLPNGLYINLRPSEHIQRQILWHGYYEKEAIGLWESFINKDSTVIDIGANIGYYSLIAAAKAKQVIAFEPSLAMRQQLSGNILLNSFTNISIEPFALADKKGQTILYISGDDNSGMNSLEKPENFSGQQETISMISFDEWALSQSLGRVDCIKIDVEGAEMKVLNGMQSYLQQHKPVIFIELVAELLQKFGYTINDVYQFLFAKGYTAYEIDEQGKLKELDQMKEAPVIVFKHSQ